MKTLYDISWQVPEAQYRADLALSYSTLAKFEREGFSKLSSLFEHISTPSLTLGSMVDTLITGGTEEFERLFYVANISPIGEKEEQIAKLLFQECYSNYGTFNDIPYEKILEKALVLNFQANWREDTRVKVLRDRCSEYYSMLKYAQSRTVVDTETYNKALQMVEALKTSPATKGYFTENENSSNIQRYYQLKFKHSFEGVNYRCMADLLIVDYEEKKVYPIDLKTSGHPEWEFQDSFLQWQYAIQARLYWRIIRACMNEDDYFKNFSLENYKFIVVNKNTLTPLVWEFPFTSSYGILLDNSTNIFYRDPFEIGKELQFYLTDNPKVPNGINLMGVNKISRLSLPVQDFRLTSY